MSTSTLTASPPSLPPLPLRGASAEALSPMQRRAMTAAILVAHVALVHGLLQVREVREAAHQIAPMFVNLIAASPPPAPPISPAPPVRVARPVLHKPPPPVRVAAAPSPAPSTFIAPAPPPEPIVEAPPAPSPLPVAQAEPAPASASAPAPPSPPPPKVIPASAVQYLEPPAPVYPHLSKRNGEQGLVLLHLEIDTAGLPHDVRVSSSSGYPRLDDAARLAVQHARFRPYTENGQPTAGWTTVPINFVLEK